MPAFLDTFGSVNEAGAPYLTSSQQSIITAIRTSAGVPGLFVCAYCGTRWGRRNTSWLGCAATLLGTALQTGSSSVAMLTVGLTVANFGYFVMVSMAATLSIELAPVPLRGLVGCLSVVGTGIASVLAAGVGWGTHAYTTSAAYRIPMGIQMFWPLLQGVLLLWVRDSPTTYLIKGDDAGAETSLRQVRHCYTEAEILDELDTLRQQSRLRLNEESVRWIEMFQGSNLRRTLLASFLGVIQQFSGSIFAAAYATVFLAGLHTGSPYALTFGLYVLVLGGGVVGLGLVTVISQRTIMLLSFAGLFAIDITVGALGFVTPPTAGVSKGIAALLLFFGFYFYMTMGPLTWLNAAELPTARLRTVTNGFVLLSISLTSLLVTYVLPYITNPDEGNLGAKVYVIFAGVMFFGLVVSYLWFPNCKGRTPAQLDQMFQARLPARKFTKWVDVDELDEKAMQKMEVSEKEHVSVEQNAVSS
ncbi:hypothetical protein M409DRAFT_65469 [Zasmidium cellare ATCC 36951]|uniref:Major facilitator superfamily (MFS) profile domain-containing protein n=1 Tax=Zasmidium cellare ATCC 36951 TaxID=1080233 RepID=A0A6A6CN04_ZASCE|nr:uncharacterized protein M409DRAFT_65469 [Zasmidium cellare ATCC 36951]KAF2168524.1 hypothetical protein M409DRAFT_65469 [Zasmidium cellare ATCC 36951]